MANANMQCPLAGWALVLCAGCGTGVFFPRPGIYAATALALVLVASAGLCHKRLRNRVWVLVAVWLAVFFAGMATGSRAGLAGIREREFLEANKRDLWVEGWVQEVREGESSNGNKRHEMKLGDVSVLNGAGERCALRVARLEMRCRVDRSAAEPRTGEFWRFKVARSQGLFWPRKERMRTTVVASGDMDQAVLAGREPARLKCWLARARKNVSDRLGWGIGPEREEEVAIARGLLLGLRGDIPGEVRGFFKHSDTGHLFAVSGLMVGMVAALMMGALRFTRLRLDHWGLVLVPGILFYGMMTGAAPSAMRACLMLTVYWVAPLLGMRVGAFSALSATAVILLAADPVNVVDAGFWLSFIVTAGLVAFTQPVMRGVAWLRRGGDAAAAEVEKLRKLRKREPVLRQWAVKWFDSSFAVSFTAWLVAAPIGAYLLEQWVPAGVLANMAIVSLTFLVVCVAGLSLGVGLFWTQGAEWVNHVVVALARCMRGLATFFAIKPLGAMEVEWPFKLAGLVGVYVLVALAGVWLHAWLATKNEDDSLPF